MAHSTQIGTNIERRMARGDRRREGERRSEERIAHMKRECRGSLPRRDMDINRQLITGEQWWSRQELF
ncbi:MAG: hypothetical protein OEM07_01620 [Gammaproteobacteria bacterium]|nr:hypothetical protein [Gammaproteobacteria bacterium]